jgi:hypothetical protein
MQSGANTGPHNRDQSWKSEVIVMDFQLSTEAILRRRRHAMDGRPERLQRVTDPDSGQSDLNKAKAAPTLACVLPGPRAVSGFLC